MAESACLASCLSTCWRFLSGETRHFAPLPPAEPPGFSPYTFLLPLRRQPPAPDAAFGVVLTPEDAQTVAAHMLGLPRQKLCDDDLRDGGAEVCNVMSACLAGAVTDGQFVTDGVPKHLDEKNYRCCAENGVL
ncbi:MAG: hypothetical protein JOY84_19255, partial [Curvibacter sp.]|nr:hypothetical protein [Curvibacter sp.]